jgi:hypothetical protein
LLGFTAPAQGGAISGTDTATVTNGAPSAWTTGLPLFGAMSFTVQITLINNTYSYMNPSGSATYVLPTDSIIKGMFSLVIGAPSSKGRKLLPLSTSTYTSPTNNATGNPWTPGSSSGY